MYWKMYADYRKEHIITTGMCTPRLAEIAHCEIRNLHFQFRLIYIFYYYFFMTICILVHILLPFCVSIA